ERRNSQSSLNHATDREVICGGICRYEFLPSPRKRSFQYDPHVAWHCEQDKGMPGQVSQSYQFPIGKSVTHGHNCDVSTSLKVLKFEINLARRGRTDHKINFII